MCRGHTCKDMGKAAMYVEQCSYTPRMAKGSQETSVAAGGCQQCGLANTLIWDFSPLEVWDTHFRLCSPVEDTLSFLVVLGKQIAESLAFGPEKHHYPANSLYRILGMNSDCPAS